ncbi:MAG: DUF4998 domain-containing protein [Prevotellaceae bacterium]|jgi:hypothetical protein|nr:DUF4998 domain-containing protein [Prevotellaceae bacterium]
MKDIIIKCFLPACLLIFMTGCEDQNFMHQKYLDEGETVYPGMADSVQYSAGNERVKFTWMLSADPRVVKNVFYWNDGEKDDSAVINRPQGVLNMEAILNVREGIHDFTLVSKDNENHKSMTVERTVQVYGPAYISRLVNRSLTISFDDGTLTINWSAVESSLFQYNTVVYTDYSNPANPATKSIRIENTDTETLIEGVREGDVFSVSSSYLPEGGLDIMDAPPVEYTIR